MSRLGLHEGPPRQCKLAHCFFAIIFPNRLARNTAFMSTSSAVVETTDEADLARARAYLEPAGSWWRAVWSQHPVACVFRHNFPGPLEQAIIGVMAQAEQENLPISLMPPSCLPYILFFVRKRPIVFLGQFSSSVHCRIP